MGSEKAHIAMFPSWGAGHVNPFIEFAKRMAADHSFTVTFITSSFLLPAPQISQLRGLASSALDIRVFEFPPPQLVEEEGGRKGKSHSGGGPLFQMLQKIEKSKGPVEEILRTLKDDICAFVTDLLCTVVIEPSKALQIPAYVLATSSASNLCLMFYHLTLHDRTTASLCEMDGRMVDIPGLPSLPAKYFPEPMQRRTDPIYRAFLRHSHRLRNADGVLVNTFQDLESRCIRAMKGLLPEGGGPEIYPVGPLLRASDSERSGCVDWLERQPVASVVYVAFGTVFNPSVEQSREMGLGLEESGERFLWVLRSGSESEILPPGFEERVAGRGLVWRELAPQMRVLSHPSIGGFVSHCGWNSALESVTCGVPLVTWPLGAEQRTTAYFVVREMGVGIEPRWGEEWRVGKEEMGRVAREIIRGEEGRRVRGKAKELKERARKAASPGGSSSEILSLLAAQWKRRA